MSPLANVISLFGEHFRQYADDVQLYNAFGQSTVASSSTDLYAFTTAIYEWLLCSCLAFNPDKSESAHFGTAGRIRSIHDVVSANVAISLLHSIESLAITLDENLKFDKHDVGAICKGSFCSHIQTLRHIRPFMPPDTAKMVACTMVSSRLQL